MEESRLERIEEEYRREQAEQEKTEEAESEEEGQISQMEEATDEAEERLREKTTEEPKETPLVKEVLPKFCCPRAVRSGNGKVKIVNVILSNENGEEQRIFKTGAFMKVTIFYERQSEPLSANFTIGITRDDGLYCYGSSVLLDANKIPIAKKKGSASILIQYNRLLPGKYLLDIGVQAEDYTPFDTICSAIEFRVTSPVINEFGILSIDHEWEVDGVQIEKTNV